MDYIRRQEMFTSSVLKRVNDFKEPRKSFAEVAKPASLLPMSATVAIDKGGFIPPHIDRCSSFEIITACMWKCRTIALQPNPTQKMSILCLVNARKRFDPPIIPEGYYGNGFVLSTAISTAEEFIRKPIGYALGLVRKAKEIVTRESIQSVADTLVIKGRPMIQVEGSYLMSDDRHLGYREVDFGWGKATFGGPVKAAPIMASFMVSFENEKGESGTVLPHSLPAQAMERFEKELKNSWQD